MCGNNMSAPLPAIVPAARKATAAVSSPDLADVPAPVRTENQRSVCHERDDVENCYQVLAASNLPSFAFCVCLFLKVIFLHGLGDTGYVSTFTSTLFYSLSETRVLFLTDSALSKPTDMAGLKLSQASGYHMWNTSVHMRKYFQFQCIVGTPGKRKLKGVKIYKISCCFHTVCFSSDACSPTMPVSLNMRMSMPSW